MPGEAFRANAVDCCAVPQSSDWEECLFEIGDGAANGIVQSTWGVLGVGAVNEARTDAGGCGLTHGEARGGGGICGGTRWVSGEGIFAGVLQATEEGGGQWDGGGD